MTWKEIEPFARCFLGENCGKMTLDEFGAEAKKRGFKSAGEFMMFIEIAGAKFLERIEDALINGTK